MKQSFTSKLRALITSDPDGKAIGPQARALVDAAIELEDARENHRNAQDRFNSHPSEYNSFMLTYAGIQYHQVFERYSKQLSTTVQPSGCGGGN